MDGLKRGSRTSRGGAAGASRARSRAAMSTAVLGGSEAPTQSQLIRGERGHPVEARAPWGLPGKPPARRAQLLGGNRMTEKRMPVAERCHVPGSFRGRSVSSRSARRTGAHVIPVVSAHPRIAASGRRFPPRAPQLRIARLQLLLFEPRWTESTIALAKWTVRRARR